ncbi:MAG TPA: ferric reductase-like transmembrane domain-containing protein [Solirubrobacteraceae bacterium]|nr:ferric reductase-like transmembrane domain-containing protein [Solirubrobacteraceae bacterium]
MIVAAAHGPSALWYATRGAGATTLVLLTAGVVLGVAEVGAWQPPLAPRFAVAALHRWVSLLALALLAVHVATTLLDPFPPIGALAAVVPFAASYRPVYLGLGTLASDLLLAVVVTSLVRRRLGFRAWRKVHWLAYGCWPVALVHGVGTGSDIRSGWLQLLTAGCVAAALAAIAVRAATADAPAPRRLAVVAGVLLATLGGGLWVVQGPLAPGWSARSGTPRNVLAAFAAPRPPGSRRAAAPVSAALTGTLASGRGEGGTGVIDLRLRLRGGMTGALRIRMGGRALPGGRLALRRSAVTFGPWSHPRRYAGRVEWLHGDRLRALVGSVGGHALRLDAVLRLGSPTVSGQVVVTPLGDSS